MIEPLRSPDSNSQPLGHKVGEYRLLREVGRGGMGVVFEAVHAETGQKVAVKAIHEKLLSNLTAVQRFVAEARLMARVSHPGLAKVLDSGQLPGGRPYFVMEFLVGDSLKTACANGAACRNKKRSSSASPWHGLLPSPTTRESFTAT